VIHILLQQLQSNKLSREIEAAATDTIFKIIEKHAADWQLTVEQMDEELAALHRWIEAQPPDFLALGCAES
jgi:predicted translin family RNA/ssDNA-binding protein